jgi:hypothetical protein
MIIRSLGAVRKECFTTESTEFHGGKEDFHIKTPCSSKLSNGQQFSVVDSYLLGISFFYSGIIAERYFRRDSTRVLSSESMDLSTCSAMGKMNCTVSSV